MKNLARDVLVGFGMYFLASTALLIHQDRKLAGSTTEPEAEPFHSIPNDN